MSNWMRGLLDKIRGLVEDKIISLIVPAGIIAVFLVLLTIWHKLSRWELIVVTVVCASGWVVSLIVIVKGRKELDPATGRPRIDRKGCVYRHPYWYDKKDQSQPLCPRCFISHEKVAMGESYMESGLECRRCVACKETITSRGCLTPSDIPGRSAIFQM
jgi:hypothetical protein